MSLVFQGGDCDLRVLLHDDFRERLGAVLESPVEGFQVQFPISLRHGSAHSIAQRFTVDHLGDGPKKSDHHDVEHHLLAELFRDAGCGDAINAHSCRQLANPYQVLFNDENAVLLELRSERYVRLLRHHHQNVGPGHVGIQHGRVGKNELRAAGPTAGFGPEVLRHGGVARLIDASRFADDEGRQDDALASESCDTDLAYWHVQASDLGPEVLRHGGVARLIDASRFADDEGRQDDALASESCDTDLAYWHVQASVST